MDLRWPIYVVPLSPSRFEHAAYQHSFLLFLLLLMLAGTRCCVQDYDSNDDGSDTGAADLENLVRWAPLGSCTRMRSTFLFFSSGK